MTNRKLALSIDELEITTFEVGSGEGRGTVDGQEDASNPITCASHCWSFCMADTDCCPETHTECDPTSCSVYTCMGNETCTLGC